jgi:hypothetical protein
LLAIGRLKSRKGEEMGSMRTYLAVASSLAGRILLRAAIVATLSKFAPAAEPSGWHLWPGVSLHPPCMMCPDDYCPKPCPTLCPVCCFGPDDYCCKPLPCTMPVKCCGPNDYCCKPLPLILPLCPTPDYTCGPPPICNFPLGKCNPSPNFK